MTPEQQRRLDTLSEERIDADAARDQENPAWHPEDFDKATRPFTPERITALRRRERLSQAAFAKRYGLSLRQIQDWEQGRKIPSAAVHTLLRVIDREPDAVARALETA